MFWSSHWLNRYFICKFVQLGPRSYIYETSREVQRIIHENCQCTLPYDFSVEDGYFICTASDYVIFRAKLTASFDSTDAIDLMSLKANLSNALARQNRKTQITVYGARYFIEPGPCGLTVPQLNSPHCLDGAPTQAAASPLQDNTVTTVVAIMSAAMVLVAFGGCIVFLVVGLRIM